MVRKERFGLGEAAAVPANNPGRRDDADSKRAGVQIHDRVVLKITCDRQFSFLELVV